MTVPPVPPILEHRPTEPHSVERRPRSSRRPAITRAVILVAVIASIVLLGQLFGRETATDPGPSTDAPVTVDPAPDGDEAVDGPGGLPNAVALTAAQIEDAALAADWDRLAALALEGGTPFTATFGEELTTVEELSAYWQGLATEEDLPRIISGLITLDDWAETTATDAATGAQTTIHVTPRFMHDPTDEAREALVDALGPQWLEMQIADDQYLGWRIGITARGDWVFLVQGD